MGLIIPAVAAYGYFRLGYAPVATAAAPMPFEKTAAKMALRARINKEATKSSPIQADEQNLLAGAQVYREHCAVCHGEPGKAASAIAKGMFPTPPQLFEDMVTDDPVGTTYWKVANGIRMTGMPAFGKSLSDTQVWQVALMLAHADKLPEPAKSVFTRPTPNAAPAMDQNKGNDKAGSISPPHSHSKTK